MPLRQRQVKGTRTFCLAGMGKAGAVAREKLLAPSRVRKWVTLKRVLMELRVVELGGM